MTASLFSLLVIPALVTGDAPAIQRQAQFEATAFYKSLNLKRVSEALAEPAGGLPRKTIRYEGAAGPAGAAQAVVTLLLERELELPTYYVKGYELTLAKPEAGLAQALQERMRGAHRLHPAQPVAPGPDRQGAGRGPAGRPGRL